MAETPETPAAVWAERLERALAARGETMATLRDETGETYCHRILNEHASDRSGRRPIDDDPEPARALWAEIGKRLGIGPPPPDW